MSTGDDFEVVSVRDATADARKATPPPSPERQGVSAPVAPRPRWMRMSAALGGGATAVGMLLGGLWTLLAPRPEPEGLREPVPVAAPVVVRWEEPEARGRRPVPAATGPLAGMVVYVSAGHGYLLHRRNFDGDPIRWGLQREAWNGVLEDLYTAAFVADVLAPQLEVAGARVVSLRERDRHEEAVLVDDLDPGFAASGWRGRVADELAGRGEATELEADGRAVWKVTVPEEGHWYLYGRWLADPRHDAEAVYTVVAGDQVVETVVDQREHGVHWWKLADLCLPGGTEVEVTLTGSGGGWLSADAVRLGGGTLVWAPPPDMVLRQHRYFDVAFAHQHDWLGGPEHLGSYACGNPRSDMRTRPNWVSWASPVGEEAAYVSIHTNGGRDQGGMVFAGIDTDPPTPPRPGAEALASFVEQQMVAEGQAVDPTYRSMGWRWGDYSEVSPVWNTLPGVLIELAYHDHPKDAARLKDPRMQRALAEGIVQGLVEWRRAGGVTAEPISPRTPPGG